MQRDVTEYIEMTGSVSSIETVEIRARVAGFLESVDFEEGDFVDEGDLLYVIDPSDYQARVDRAEASIEMATASMRLANATLRRLEQARRTSVRHDSAFPVPGMSVLLFNSNTHAAPVRYIVAHAIRTPHVALADGTPGGTAPAMRTGILELVCAR